MKTLEYCAQQSDTLEQITDALELDENNHALVVLTGSAGTGKTTMIHQLTSTIDRPCFLSATTHAAVKVLQSTVDKFTVCSTAHKLFGLKPGIDKYGNETLKSQSYKALDLKPDAVVIIDESSMISDKFLRAIADIVKDLRLKIVFVGDFYQLPPVKGICSIFDGSLPTFHLTKVYRQMEDNPILKKSLEYCEYIDGTRTELPEMETLLNSRGEGIHSMNHQKFVQAFVGKYINFSPGDPVDAPMCVYTNESAINYNNMIQKATYLLEDHSQPYYVGEHLISNSAVLVEEKVILSNNEKVEVMSYAETNLNEVTGHNVAVRRIESDRDIVSVFVPSNPKQVKDYLKHHKSHAVKTGNWKDYYAVLNYFADLRLPFAGTTHKAQGATYPEVFIDYTNIMKCKNPQVKARLMYVALTRAQHNVYINN